jgi:hypothetical protein
VSDTAARQAADVSAMKHPAAAPGQQESGNGGNYLDVGFGAWTPGTIKTKEEVFMDIVARAKAISLNPKETWEIVKGEQMTIKELYTSYAAILALIPPIATFIGFSLVGVGMPLLGRWRQPVMNGLVHAIIYYVLTLVGVYVTAYVADRLAPSFNSKQDLTSAVKAVVYSYTPVWIVSVLNVIPGLSVLGMIAGLYSLYLLYLGLPTMMDTPPEKKVGYVVAVIVTSIVVMVLISMIAGLFLASAHVGQLGPRL